MSRIFLSTPLRDEIDNIDRLFASIEAQDVSIDLWVIVENGSVDGSKEALRIKSKPANVSELVVLNHPGFDSDYALGSKYASIVNEGFTEIQRRRSLSDDDLIGILDADSFPLPGYYRELVVAFANDPRLGICSGSSVDLDSGAASGHARDWVRGSCRLWRGACFVEAGYIIGPSADTLSLAKAKLCGWSAYVADGAVFEARDVGTRVDYRYYGKSAHFRGNTALYAMARVAKFLVGGHYGKARAFGAGYFGCVITGAKRVQDREIRRYFSAYLRRKALDAVNQRA